ncbi:MAG: alpha/beta fold hydrolase, partial [Rubrobacteraceae bacterium]
WCLGADMWEYQMAPLAEAGFRCVAYDVRGCGRSDQPAAGYDFDTLADDLAAVVEGLGLRGATLVGHSAGSAQILRYLSRHGDGRTARAALVSTTAPYLLKTGDNPEGVDGAVLDDIVSGLRDDRPRWAASLAKPWFGAGLPGVSVSPEMLDWAVGMFLQASPRAAIETIRAVYTTDLRADAREMDVPTLIVHGAADVMAPFEASARRLAEEIPHAKLVVYENASHGPFISHKELLNDDLLSFLGSPAEARATR